MSTLDTNTGKRGKRLGRTVWTYLIVTGATIAIDKVYGVYSHGVDSEAMTWMFLYPLLCGALYCFTIGRIFPRIMNSAGGRMFLNLHHSGIAALTIAALLKGVFEIAGTDSPYLVYYEAGGWGFIAAGLVMLLVQIAANARKFSGKKGYR